MFVDLARMYRASLDDELQQQLRELLSFCGPSRASPRVGNLPVARGEGAPARMHQRLDVVSHESIVDEEIFRDAELRVVPLEVSRAVVFDPMAQGQILRPRRRANRIRLYEAHLVHRPSKRGGLEQTAS